MTGKPRRRDDRILDPSYLEGLESLATSELRRRKGECEEFESELSYARRLLHGKIDILGHELGRRASGGEGAVGDLVAKLPEILAEAPTGNAGRFPRILLPRQIERQRRKIELLASDATLARIDEATTDEIQSMVERIANAERDLSPQRRAVQGVMDALSAELVRRYREGQEDPTALLRT